MMLALALLGLGQAVDLVAQAAQGDTLDRGDLGVDEVVLVDFAVHGYACQCRPHREQFASFLAKSHEAVLSAQSELGSSMRCRRRTP